ncbi:hypothetical protein CAC42_1257 [Sphaceloma murrayae]|uniref:Pyruvate dehydrogenase complex protein X component, mitochondrial n=1 Tax=Sphaceloma murrayae TaxID=2082308 RepID=A0A2K1R2F6_9PEZI|nr:hypothetical protein CAC42_1257 [Sphaceloma murrayae]
MSPTMTEGNIASWKVKEGESFSAGDVLLEIETDKAQMDVEAQEDGIMFKITQTDGSKGVKVGSRIAVLAESGDDVSSLAVPEEDTSTSSSATSKNTSPQEETKGGVDEAKSSESQVEAPPSSKAGSAPSESSRTSAETTPTKLQKQKYPLYPSVVFALKEHGLTKEDADKITATGPGGRLLKGDVLSYVGSIDKDYSSKQSSRLAKLGHMDLSNIQLAPPKPSAKATKEETAATLPPPPADTEIAVPISLSAVIATQKRVQDTLGISLPLSVFIGRASDLANEDLPMTKGSPTADDLFYSVLGLDNVVERSSRGAFFPMISSLAPATSLRTPKKADLFDEILGAKPKKQSTSVAPPVIGTDGVATASNVFSVIAKQGEEQRAQAYLERIKLVLESEPGRLVL